MFKLRHYLLALTLGYFLSAACEAGVTGVAGGTTYGNPGSGAAGNGFSSGSGPSGPAAPAGASRPPAPTSNFAGAPSGSVGPLNTAAAGIMQGGNFFNPSAIGAYNAAVNASTLASQAYLADAFSGKYDTSNYQIPLLAAAAQMAAAQQAAAQGGNSSGSNSGGGPAPTTKTQLPSISVPSVSPPVDVPTPSNETVSLPPIQTQTWKDTNGQEFKAVVKENLPTIPQPTAPAFQANLTPDTRTTDSFNSIVIGDPKNPTPPSIVDNLKPRTPSNLPPRQVASTGPVHSASLAQLSLAAKVAEALSSLNKAPEKPKAKDAVANAKAASGISGAHSDDALVVVPGAENESIAAGAGKAPSLVERLKSAAGVSGKVPYRKLASLALGEPNANRVKALMGTMGTEIAEESNMPLMALFSLVGLMVLGWGISQAFKKNHKR